MNRITIRRPSPFSLTPRRTKHAFDYQLHPPLGRSPLYDTAFYFNISALISPIFPFHFRFQKTLISAFFGGYLHSDGFGLDSFVTWVWKKSAMRLHDGKHGHRFTFYSALLIASRHFWANLYSRAWARLLDLWGLAGHWPPTSIAPFDGVFFFLLLDASFDTRFSTCTRDSGYIPGVGNLWWNFNGFGHLLAKVASSDGGGLRIHWLDVIHLLILGFCFFLFFFLFFLFFFSFSLSFFLFSVLNISLPLALGKMLYYQSDTGCAGCSRRRHRAEPQIKQKIRTGTLDVPRLLI